LPVRANLVVGAIGVVLALSSGSYIVANWTDLAQLETWVATFETRDVRLPDRAAGLAPGGTRTEVHEILNRNVTHIEVDLTWSDPPLNAPEITLRLMDPTRRVRAEQGHTGGASGIHLRFDLIDPSDVPSGSAQYRVRHDPRDQFARAEFESRWPEHTEAEGRWTVEIRSAAPDGPAPSGNVAYTLQVRYAYYTGSFEPLPEPAG
jgi:hypothetical protein